MRKVSVVYFRSVNVKRNWAHLEDKKLTTRS